MARTLGFLGISNSPIGLILVHTVYGLGFTTLFFRNYYVSISDEIIKAVKNVDEETGLPDIPEIADKPDTHLQDQICTIHSYFRGEYVSINKY